MIFDDKLNFEEQFNRVKSKLKNGVKALMCTRLTLNFRAKMLLYNGAFKSHIEYCSLAYLDKLNKKQINELYTLQKQAVRLIFNAKKNVHTEKLFKLAGILPLTKMYQAEAIKMVYKNWTEHLSDTQPVAIRDLIIPSSEDNARIYLNQNKIKIPSVYKKGACFYNMINVWNNSSPDARNSGNLWSLKKFIKDDFIQSLPLCHAKKCNICALDENKDYPKYMSI